MSSLAARPGTYDASLFAASGGTSREEFGLVFDAHSQEVFRYCYARCGDVADAEDMMSIVFLEAWRCRSKSTVIDGSLRPWLYGIAANVLRSSRRSKHRYAAALDRFHAMNPSVATPDFADESGAAMTAYAARTSLARALAELPEKERVVIDLMLIQGCGIRATAEALQIPEGTVKSRLARARHRLRRLLRTGDWTDPLQSERT